MHSVNRSGFVFAALTDGGNRRWRRLIVAAAFPMTRSSPPAFGDTSQPAPAWEWPATGCPTAETFRQAGCIRRSLLDHVAGCGVGAWLVAGLIPNPSRPAPRHTPAPPARQLREPPLDNCRDGPGPFRPSATVAAPTGPLPSNLIAGALFPILCAPAVRLRRISPN